MARSKRLVVVAVQVCCLVLSGMLGGADAQDEAAYVGTETCAECHPEQAERFEIFSKKAHSYTSIQRLADKLTPQERSECYACHTTGYGKPGGFVSATQTPQLMNLGCETCHGPGSLHVDSEDPSDLKGVVIEDCMTCHNEDRIAAFNFKPLLFGGGH